MTAHNTASFDGPVCMLCGCGDEYVIDTNPIVVHHINVWREVGVVALIAAVVMAGVLLTIWALQGMVVPWK